MAPVRVMITGALDVVCTIPDHLLLLLKLFGEGLEGDIRVSGNTTDAVDAVRGLALGTGACRRIEPPADSPLYCAGDECYLQPPATLVFLDPRPTG